jgi:hypothetical protein
VEDLRKAGYTPFLGMFGVGGPYFENFGSFGNYAETSIFYFNRGTKQMVVDVAALVSKDISIKAVDHFVDLAGFRDDRKFVVENAGLDLQLYLYRLQR